MPAVNQIEVHPYFQQRDVLATNAAHGILSQAWFPSAESSLPRRKAHQHAGERDHRGHRREARQVTGAGDAALGSAPGRSVIPKSTRPERIAENFAVFDFQLTDTELTVIDTLDTDARAAPNPRTSPWKPSSEAYQTRDRRASLSTPLRSLHGLGPTLPDRGPDPLPLTTVDHCPPDDPLNP